MALNLADLMVTIGGNASGALSALDQTQGRIEGLSNKMGSFARSMAPLSAAITGIGYAGIRAFSSLEDAMTEISVRTGIVGGDLQSMEDFAVRMGQATQYSATQAAESLLQIVTTGSTAAEAMEILPEVLSLAAAGGIDLAFSADAVTDVLAMFNMEVSRAADVTQILGAASGASSAEVFDLIQGFQNVGPVARTFGISIEETAATLAVLSENGVKSAEAGTALRSMLVAMTGDSAPAKRAWDQLGTSFFDAEGNARAFGDVLADIREGLSGMTEQEASQLLLDLAGSYGAVGLAALTGDMSIEQMMETMGEQTDVAEVAAGRMSTFSGIITSLRGSIEVMLGRAMRPLIERGFKPLASGAIDVVNAFGDLISSNDDVAFAIGAVLAGLVALTAAAGALAFTLPVITAGFGFLATTVLPIAAGLAAIGLAARVAIGDMGTFVDTVKEGFLEGGVTGAVEAAVDLMTSNIMGIVNSARVAAEEFIGQFTSAFEEGGFVAVGELILEKIKTGLGDVVSWATENIVGPILEALGLMGEEPTAPPVPGLLPTPEWMSGAATMPSLGDAEVVVDSLRLRSGPGTDYEIVGGLPEGVTAAVLAVIEDEGDTWAQVLTDQGVKAWMALAYNDQIMASFTPQAEITAGLAAEKMAELAEQKVNELMATAVSDIPADLSPQQSKIKNLLDSVTGDAITWDPGEAGGIDWGAKGRQLVEKMFESIGTVDVSGFASKIVEAINNIDWKQAGLDALAFAESILTGLADAAIDAGTWVNEEIATPLADAIRDVDWESTMASAGETLDSILNGLSQGATDFSRWARINVLYPVVDAVKGVDWEGTVTSVGVTIDSILDGITSTATSFTDWVSEKVLKPAADAIGGITAEDWVGANADLANGLTDILDAIISGGIDILSWVLTHIVEPIGEELLKPETWAAAMTGVGAILLAAVTWALEIAGWATEKLVEMAGAFIEAMSDPATYDKFVEVGGKMGDAIVKGIMGSLVSSTAWPIIQLRNGQIPGSGGGDSGGGGGGGTSTPVPGGGGGRSGGSTPSEDRGWFSLPSIPIAPLISGIFDDGGHLGAGEIGLIGTRAQPELFVPDTAGTLYPAGTYGGVNIYGQVVVQKVPEDGGLYAGLNRAVERRNLMKLPERSMI